MLIYLIFASVTLAFGADIAHVNDVPQVKVVDLLQKNVYQGRECDCGEFSRGCDFDESGSKVCECLPGYAQANGTYTPFPRLTNHQAISRQHQNIISSLSSNKSRYGLRVTKYFPDRISSEPGNDYEPITPESRISSSKLTIDFKKLSHIFFILKRTLPLKSPFEHWTPDMANSQIEKTFR
ncbi:uncharacterized protein TNIN_414921 [Trichonephila inaurata madagascariensis]|uniref:EGF-like domain-containing protein n=1 Tax=Trichonephila inaurata madagascariensis TaxID=2747483 RepID=A0A8X7C8C4_9ARAC|nr:uncharacterized protein TNIN_414921 [Trichonephila inaurata madagascariensis]